MKYRKLNGWKYELVEPLVVAVPELADATAYHPYIKLNDGVLGLIESYAWDGATGVPDNPDNMRGSAVHDALYQLMRLNLLDRNKYKDIADNILWRLCIEDGMKLFWANIIFDGVQAFGKGATEPDKNEKGEIIEI